MTGPPRPVAIVPHTHWDREWYLPFQSFRMRLVEFLDGLLPVLEEGSSFPRFLLDGQTAVVDDYLAVRPEAEARLRALVERGRLAIGPWAVLMDEFMVSGETIVRDLQRGMRRAEELGGAMEVGYLPDMFGHVAQMPQVLRLAGLEHAVVWRGVPATVEGTAFAWSAPDGSVVRAEYLYGSYSNGRDLPDDPAALVERAHSFAVEVGSEVGGPLLLMNGTDHQLPQPWVGRVAAEANDRQDEFHFCVTSLPELLGDRGLDGLTAWEGELRSGARANVLMGVASNRVDVHRSAAAAEAALERRAEPLAALFLQPDDPASTYLDEAWQLLVLNSAHDSSCACSADEVVEQVLVRYREARQLADGVTRHAAHTLAADIDAPAGSTLVLNPTARPRGGIVEVSVPGADAVELRAPDGTPVLTQEIERRHGPLFSATVVGPKLRWIVDAMRGPEFRGRGVAAYDLRDGTDAIEVELREASPGGATVNLDPLRETLLERMGSDTTFRVTFLRAPSRRLLVRVPEVPGFGWRTLTRAAPDSLHPPARPATSDAGHLVNEHLDVRVDDATGTVRVETDDGVVVTGANRLVEGGDGGDTYNYSPPTEDRIVDEASSITVSTLETGPVRALVRVDTVYDWPAGAVGDERSCRARSEETRPAEVATYYELRAGERFLRVRVELDHHHRDHRLRAHFPLPRPAVRSRAECAFTVVSRGLETEGGPHEHPLPTFPSRRFVDAGDGEEGLLVLHRGLLEYELVEDGAELALTLLRATGYLSRSEPTLRPNPAGPLDPLEAAQLPGPLVAEYALLPHRSDWRTADAYAAADQLCTPLVRTRGGGAGRRRAPTGQALDVDGAEVSALLREDDSLVVRCFNPASERAELSVQRDGRPLAGSVVDLRGRTVGTFDGSRGLRPHEIVTLKLPLP